MKYIYKINYKHPTWPQFDIEADSYAISDGFFTFKERVQGSQNGRPVASVKADMVFDIQRIDKE
ncbi:hypothetical protein [Curtobacterium sp. C2H10]|uniref:hypothetical protein n=1 Tax=Curtobacterium sp. C2H10 TaxID=2736664 RepID=UPI0021C068A6|nr:hypothetical protein [Curtobacterium sp. C2H10]MCT9620737.1 hypothetical protein [Curtobacterium sp. C2H10]